MTNQFKNEQSCFSREKYMNGLWAKEKVAYIIRYSGSENMPQ